MSQTVNRTEEQKKIISDYLKQHDFKLVELDHSFSAGQMFFIAEYTGKSNNCAVPLYLKILNVAFKKELIHFCLPVSDLELLQNYNS